jgi:hypothetical protein
MGDRQRMRDMEQKTCRACGAVTSDDPPAGWYSLSVHIPASWTTASGKPYLYVGLFCGSACLAAYMPEVARQERLAEGSYERATIDDQGRGSR